MPYNINSYELSLLAREISFKLSQIILTKILKTKKCQILIKN